MLRYDPRAVPTDFKDGVGTRAFASGHTLLRTPDPIRTRKLSSRRPGQYWGGGPPGKPLGAAGFCSFLVRPSALRIT